MFIPTAHAAASNALKQINPVPQGMSTIPGFLNTILPSVFLIAGMLLLVMFLVAGFNYLTSTTNADKAEGAKRQLTTAAVGFLILFSAFWILQALTYILGLENILSI